MKKYGSVTKINEGNKIDHDIAAGQKAMFLIIIYIKLLSAFNTLVIKSSIWNFCLINLTTSRT